MLFDYDALITNIRFESMNATPLNARHLFRVNWWHFLFSNWTDYSENGIVYYMSDTSTAYFEGDGVKDDFTVTATTIVKVTVNGVEKTAGTDYTFSSNTLTFTTAPAADAIIQIIYK